MTRTAARQDAGLLAAAAAGDEFALRRIIAENNTACGDSAHDTADFQDESEFGPPPGNLRADYAN